MGKGRWNRGRGLGEDGGRGKRKQEEGRGSSEGQKGDKGGGKAR
jgi:hypothetical protein